VAAQYDRVIDALEPKYREAAEHLNAARAELLAFTTYPREIWRQIWSNKPQERLNKEKSAAAPTWSGSSLAATP